MGALGSDVTTGDGELEGEGDGEGLGLAPGLVVPVLEVPGSRKYCT